MSQKINGTPAIQTPSSQEVVPDARASPAPEATTNPTPTELPLQKTFTDEQSSNVREISYDPELSEMSVTFNGGSKYLYSLVPVEIFQGALDAVSIGSYFQAKIKHVYEFKKAAA